MKNRTLNKESPRMLIRILTFGVEAKGIYYRE